MTRRRYALTIGTILLTMLALGVGFTFADTHESPNHRTVEVAMRMFGYEPGRIVVNQGETVTFKLKSEDVTHGFYIDGYDVNAKVHFGQDETVTIVADKPGKFKIRCSSTCGPLHPFMVGELVVEQSGVNTVFLGSAGLVSLIGVLTLIFVYRRGNDLG